METTTKKFFPKGALTNFDELKNATGKVLHRTSVEDNVVIDRFSIKLDKIRLTRVEGLSVSAMLLCDSYVEILRPFPFRILLGENYSYSCFVFPNFWMAYAFKVSVDNKSYLEMQQCQDITSPLNALKSR